MNPHEDDPYAAGEFATDSLDQSSEESSGWMRLLLPVGRSGWAICAGYLGLFSILLVPAPFAIVTGLLGLRDIRRHEHLHGKGRAIFGIVMGAFFTLLTAAAFIG